VHSCNLGTREAESGGLQVQGQHELHNETPSKEKEGIKEGKKEKIEAQWTL
jgi:hypothetical protein